MPKYTFLAIFHVAAGGGPLEVAVEFDPAWWIEVNALDLPAQAFTFGKTGHHLQ